MHQNMCAIFCSDVKKDTLSCNRLSEIMKHGRTTMNLQGNIKARSGNASPPRTKKFRSVSSASKVILMLFWDLNGPILEHYQDHGQVVTSAWYCAMLEEEMKHAMQRNADKWSCFVS